MMERGFFISLVIAIPVILFPVALGWYLNIGQFITNVGEAILRKVSRHGSGKALPDNVK